MLVDILVVSKFIYLVIGYVSKDTKLIFLFQTTIHPSSTSTEAIKFV